MNTIYVCLIVCLVRSTESSRILVVFPTPSYSHIVTGKLLFEDLAERGHELTIISPYPQETPKRCRDITLPGTREVLLESLKEMNLFEYEGVSVFKKIMDIHTAGVSITKHMFEQRNVQNLIKSNEHFDLIILDNFINEAIYGFCHHFKAPCMSMSMVNPSIWSNRLTGNVGLSSYVPELFSRYSPKMTFWERLHNLVAHIFHELLFHIDVLPKQNEIMQANFPGAPHLYNLMYNTSIIIINSHPGLSAPVPLFPNMLELGGLHIKDDVILPGEIQKFLDDHDEGVVYFSFGTNCESKDMPPEKLKRIMKAIKQWNKPILWKFEGDHLPENVPNVKFAKWFPQPAVLAHKNVKAFISHMGRLSTLESVYFGVPMIGIPLFGEQSFNAAQMLHAGYGIKLEFKTLNETHLYDALVEITSNPKYSEKAKMISETMRSKPLSARDEAVYWVEYVIKYRGAPLLRNAGIDLPWYQLWMVDIMLLVCFITGFSGLLIYVLVRICCQSRSSTKNKGKSKKE